jgi:hypothetical protein
MAFWNNLNIRKKLLYSILALAVVLGYPLEFVPIAPGPSFPRFLETHAPGRVKGRPEYVLKTSDGSGRTLAANSKSKFGTSLRAARSFQGQRLDASWIERLNQFAVLIWQMTKHISFGL